ncbi:MAG: HAD family hydrolase [Desulfobacterales bacterium]|jgi:putative hydrolase of the HAD superfamily
MIFFDIDETLMNNTAAERAAAAKFYDLHKDVLQTPLEKFIHRWQTLTERNIQRYLAGELSFEGQRRERLRQVFANKRSLSDAEADAIFDAYLHFYENSWILFPDVEDCLNALSGHHLGIISNGDAIQQRQKLHSLGIIDRFSTIVISGEVSITKPAPQIFKMACQKAGSRPSACWHIGDNFKVDVQGSISAGMKGIWLNRDGHKQPTDIPTITSLRDLKDKIKSTASRMS